jgi:hypothetical protein
VRGRERVVISGTGASTALLLWVLSTGAPTYAEGSGQGGNEVFYVDATLDFDGDVLDWRFVDLVGDTGEELVVVVGLDGGERELRVHTLERGTIAREALHAVPLLKDILAWGIGDVRPELGPELLLMTPGGVWSYSLEHAGYRDNVLPLVRADLIYDLPDPREVAYWEYVLPSAGGDLVLVPERDGISLWGPTAGAAPSTPYGRRAVFGELVETTRLAAGAEDPDLQIGEGSADSSTSVTIGGDGTTVENEFSSLFIDENLRAGAELFSVSFSYDAPALVDLDGDGSLDLLRLTSASLIVHRGGKDGPATPPTRTEPLPDDLKEEDGESLKWNLVDLDGDGDLDLLAQAVPEVDGLENALNRILIYRFDGTTLLREKPDQILRVEAGDLGISVVDVDGDGRVDLAMRKFMLPSLVGVVTGLEFEISTIVFLGERKGFARRPFLKDVDTFDEEGFADVFAVRNIVGDCDGDGIADLVEMDLNGAISIRRLRRESSFFGGAEWSIDDSAWKTFKPSGELRDVVTEDLNGDGFPDIGCAGEGRLSLFLSTRGQGQ